MQWQLLLTAVLSSFQKAYLEINSRSAESMVKFYTCFPMTLDGNQLCIAMAPQHRSVRDEVSTACWRVMACAHT